MPDQPVGGASADPRAARSSTGRLWCTTFLLVWLLVGLPASVWAVVTPPFGVADEGAHVINTAAVVRGQALTDEIAAGGGGYQHAPLVTVPGYLAQAETASECFEREPSVPMTCAPAFDGSPSEPGQMVTHAGNYPPLFYLLVGWLTFILDGAPVVVAMRLVSALVCSAVVAAGAATLRLVHPGRGAVVAVLLATTPMAVSLFGSVNPSGLEIALSVALWAGMLTFASTSATAVDARLLFVGVSAAALANARPAAMLWAALIILVALILVPSRTWRLIWGRRSLWVALGTAAAGALLSVLWFLLADPGRSIGGHGDVDLSEYGSLGAVQQAHLGNLYGYALALVGNLGWLDTPLPHWAVMLYGLAAFGLIWAALALGRWRGVVALLAAVVLLVQAPVLVQFPNATEVGLIWQGRYSLPLWVGIPLLGFVVLALRQDAPWRGLADRFVMPAIVVVLIMHATMFRVALPRFYVGYGEEMDLGAAPGHVPWTLALLVVPVVLSVLLVVAHALDRGADQRRGRAGAPAGTLS